MTSDFSEEEVSENLSWDEQERLAAEHDKKIAQRQFESGMMQRKGLPQKKGIPQNKKHTLNRRR